MRQHGHLGMQPESVIGGQGLDLEHVEHCMADLATGQRRQQVGVDQVGAARQVHQAGTTRQRCEQVSVDQAAGVSRQRQQVDQDAGLPQRVGQRRRAVQHPNACQRFNARGIGRAAPPGADRIALLRQPARHRTSHLTKTQHQHRRLVGAALAMDLPARSPLVAGVFEESALQGQRRPQRGLSHRRVHRRVDHARQRHPHRQGLVAQQAVDTGPQRLDQPQSRQA